MRRFVFKKIANLWGDGRGHIKAQVHGKIDAWMGGPIHHITKVPIYSKFWSNFGH